MRRSVVLVTLLISTTEAVNSCSKDALIGDCLQTPSKMTTRSLKEEIKQYQKEGWAVVRGVLDSKLMKEVRDHVDYLLKKYPDIPGGNPQSGLIANYW